MAGCKESCLYLCDPLRNLRVLCNTDYAWEYKSLLPLILESFFCSRIGEEGWFIFLWLMPSASHFLLAQKVTQKGTLPLLLRKGSAGQRTAIITTGC
jgi:hypothetical protein